MNDSVWHDVRRRQLDRLEKASALLDRISVLCERAPQSEVPSGIVEQVMKLRPRVDLQLKKLRENRFEVAVIGLEKAGKSALLNAWLGVDILPSTAERCTYTSMEIWSAPSEGDQEVHIEYLSQADHSRLLAEKRSAMNESRKGTRDHDDLRKDVEETEQLGTAIGRYIARGQERQTFGAITEIRDLLQEVVFRDRARARAARRIALKTIRLREDRDIIFHDVPGFDSPVTIHQEQAMARLKSCDAIIYAKRSDQPSLTGPEESMVAVADDDAVTIADKLFVAFTRIDSARDDDELNGWYKMARMSWPTVSPSRLIGVCPPGHLAKLGTGTPETNRLGAISNETLAKIGRTDGIDELKQAVNHYIDNDRARVLEKRCVALAAESVRCARELLKAIGDKYPEDIAELDSRAAEAGQNRFYEWWGGEWQRIEKEFQNWFFSVIQERPNADAAPGQHVEIQRLKESYEAGVRSALSGLKSVDANTMEQIYITAYNASALSVSQGHAKVRGALHREASLEVEKISLRLAESLASMLELVCQKARELMWGLPDVEKQLILDREKARERIEHGLDTLFLRFGRVAVDAFLAYPRSQRKSLLEEHRAEIATLGHFYRGPEVDRRKGLETFLMLGEFVVQAAEATGHVPPGASNLFGALKKKVPDISERGKPMNPAGEATHPAPEAAKFEDVKKEVLADLAMLQEYLLHSVFHAAGFAAYCGQELERVRDRFLQLENVGRRWTNVVHSAVQRKNPLVPFQLADQERDLRAQREIAADLQDVRKFLLGLS